MSKFTPGPWSHIGQGDITGREDNGGTVDVCCVYLRTAPGRTEANARLIAAAPALYEALKETRKRLQDANEVGIITDTLWYSEYETLFDYVDVALALVGGGE